MEIQPLVCVGILFCETTIARAWVSKDALKCPMYCDQYPYLERDQCTTYMVRLRMSYVGWAIAMVRWTPKAPNSLKARVMAGTRDRDGIERNEHSRSLLRTRAEVDSWSRRHHQFKVAAAHIDTPPMSTSSNACKRIDCWTWVSSQVLCSAEPKHLEQDSAQLSSQTSSGISEKSNDSSQIPTVLWSMFISTFVYYNNSSGVFKRYGFKTTSHAVLNRTLLSLCICVCKFSMTNGFHTGNQGFTYSVKLQCMPRPWYTISSKTELERDHNVDWAEIYTGLIKWLEKVEKGTSHDEQIEYYGQGLLPAWNCDVFRAMSLKVCLCTVRSSIAEASHSRKADNRLDLDSVNLFHVFHR